MEKYPGGDDCNLGRGKGGKPRDILLLHHKFQVPKMEESSPMYAACKAYVRGNPNPPPKQPYLGQETLHFRYLTKLLVMIVSFGSIHRISSSVATLRLFVGPM